jgi:hypothetical protein
VHIAKESGLMTDEARHYMEPGRDFTSHEAVNHGEKEYVRYWNEATNEMRPDGKPHVETTTITTNTVEGYYSIFKRGMKASISIAQRSTCTATFQSLTSVIPIASHWASTTGNVRTLPSRARLASV